MFKEFPNLKLLHMRCLKECRIIAAFGYRTCIILNEDMDVQCRFLDSNKTERFYCGEFFINNLTDFCSSNKYFFILGGENGILKILDLTEGLLATYITGHTGAICDIKILDSYVVTSGEDSSIRVWDLRTLSCVGVLGGLFAHKDHVLSIDIMNRSHMLVSAGTDCAIKQWKISTKEYFNYEPYTTFNNVHRSPINKVKYYGNMILSLSNGIISMVYSHNEPLEENFGLCRNDPIFIGSIDLFNNCKTFEIFDHILIGIGNNGDVYIFDLRSIINEKAPFLVSTNIESTEDFIYMNDHLYISSGDKIHKFRIDLSNFNSNKTGGDFFKI